MKRIAAGLFLPLFVLLGSACHPRPVEDLALADVAIRAAQKVKADSLAPDTFRKAENYYLRAKRDFGDGYFDSAKKFATDARKLAEQAEYRALAKQSQLKNRPEEEGQPPPPAGAEPPPPSGGPPPAGMPGGPAGGPGGAPEGPGGPQ